MRCVVVMVALVLCWTAPACSDDDAGTDSGSAPAKGGKEPAAAAPGPRASEDLLTPATRLAGLKLKTIEAALGSSKVEERKAMVERLMQAAPADAPTLHRWLHREVKVPVADMKNVLRSIGAAVPDGKGRFTKPARVKDLDWLDALLSTREDGLSEALRPALRECLLTVALLRATAGSGHPDAAVSLVRFGYRHRGAFRDECGARIRGMGLGAVPGLVRVRNLRDELAFKMKRYASYQMDRMNWTRPGRVLKLAGPELKAELLHAYGEVRGTSAVGAVLDHTDHAVEQVRRAARWAMLRYVSGRPPRAQKRKLKLVGGRKTERARTVYYTYQQLATHALADRLARALGRRTEDARRRLMAENEPRHLAERLFAAQDKALDMARARELKAALARASAGKLQQALETFDLILAAAPFHPRRHEMAPFYHRRAEDLLATRKPEATREALLLLTKAIHLGPKAEFVSQARARRLVVEALQAPQDSEARRTALNQALAMAPNHQQAARELERARGRQRSRLFVTGGVGLAVALGLVVGLALVRRRVVN